MNHQHRPTTALQLTGPWIAWLLLAGAALLGSAQAAAGDSQSLDAIEAAASRYISQQIGKDFPAHRVQIGKLDPRLQLSACDTDLQTFLPPGSRLPGNTTVGVSCEGQKPWTIYVSAEVKAMREVVVSRRPLIRGATIGADDIRLELREVSANQSYITDPRHVIGKLIKRPMAADSLLSPNALASAPLIRRGQQIVIVASTPGIDVRMQGTALSDGGKGDRIRVRNLLSQRTVEATVVQAGVVQVTL